MSTWVYDERNRLTASSDEGTYRWTSRGTLYSITGNDGQVRNYRYDGLGQLANAEGVAYQYDGLGRLANRDESGQSQFMYSGLTRDPVSDGDTQYGRSPSGVLTSLRTDSGDRRSVGLDRFGDVTFLTGVNGTLAESMTYNPFGEVHKRWGGEDPKVGFQGDWTDPTTGDVNMDARWYSPTSGTFNSRDTYSGELSTPLSLNRYTYGNNNPIRYWDPTGLCSAVQSATSGCLPTAPGTSGACPFGGCPVVSGPGADPMRDAQLIAGAAANVILAADNGLTYSLSQEEEAAIARQEVAEREGFGWAEFGAIRIPIVTPTGFAAGGSFNTSVSVAQAGEISAGVALGIACAKAVAATPISGGASLAAAAVVCGAATSMLAGAFGNKLAGREVTDGLVQDGFFGAAGGAIGVGFGGRVTSLVDDVVPAGPGGLLDDTVPVAPSSARVWTSVDDHVGGAANAIESALPGRITGVNQNITMTTRSGFREVDIVLDGVLVQVKGGNARGLTGQVLRTSETTGQTVIGFAPDIPEAAWAAAARQGVPIARNHDELIAMIAELG